MVGQRRAGRHDQQVRKGLRNWTVWSTDGRDSAAGSRYRMAEIASGPCWPTNAQWLLEYTYPARRWDRKAQKRRLKQLARGGGREGRGGQTGLRDCAGGEVVPVKGNLIKMKLCGLKRHARRGGHVGLGDRACKRGCAGRGDCGERGGCAVTGDSG